MHINEPGTNGLGGFRDGYARRGCGRIHHAGGHAAELPAGDVTVAALEAKREAARGKCRVDWAAWGGVVSGNQGDIEPLAAAGVLGFQMLSDPSGHRRLHDGYRTATARRRCPTLRGRACRCWCMRNLPALWMRPPQTWRADWRSYATYLKSRPDEAELSAIRLLLSLCREYHFRLHIVHLATRQRARRSAGRARRGTPGQRRNLPALFAFGRGNDRRRSDAVQMRAADSKPRKSREAVGGPAEGVIDLVATDHSPCPPSMKQLEAGNFRTLGAASRAFRWRCR